MASPLMERHGDRIAGVLACYDRVVVAGNLVGSAFDTNAALNRCEPRIVFR
jgi:hypothetical protein